MLRKVVLDHNGQLYNGTIRNVSATGALVEGLWNVPVGTIFKIQILPTRNRSPRPPGGAAQQRGPHGSGVRGAAEAGRQRQDRGGAGAECLSRLRRGRLLREAG